MTARARKESTVDTENTFPGQVTEDELNTASTEDSQMVLSDRYDTEALQKIGSFQEALELVGSTLGYVEDAAKAMGDGFALLSSDGAKARLVKKPLILMSWDFYPGDFGDEFAAIRIVAQEDNGTISKYIVNDGSTGVAKMLREFTNKTGKRGGLLVRNGFRASEYDFCEECRSATCAEPVPHKEAGHHKRATTYYIDTSL